MKNVKQPGLYMIEFRRGMLIATIDLSSWDSLNCLSVHGHDATACHRAQYYPTPHANTTELPGFSFLSYSKVIQAFLLCTLE